MKPRFFRTSSEFRSWLTRHHASTPELWVGFHKRGTGRASITWPESVDQALCFGWIDGVRKSLGDESYVIRFTPRRARSVWSSVNVRRIRELVAKRLVRPAGLKAFAAREERRSGIYSYEQARRRGLDATSMRRVRANRAAWKFFSAQPPWYRRTAAFWVTSAKQEATRERRLSTLIADSAAGQLVGPLRRAPKRAAEAVAVRASKSRGRRE